MRSRPPSNGTSHSEQRRAIVQQHLERFGTLTARERQVLREVANGRLNKQIAFDLGISEVTVKLHRSNVMRKMQAGSVGDLIRAWETLPASVREKGAHLDQVWLQLKADLPGTRFMTQTVWQQGQSVCPIRLLIAIVDDDESMREALSELLEVFELPSRVFDGADAFLAAYAPVAFDCLITDIRMPGMSGLELQQKLNSLGSTIPVIVVTSSNDPLTVLAY